MVYRPGNKEKDGYEMSVMLPWPPTKTSANGSQADYHGKARAAKSYKQVCAWECVRQKVKTINAPGDYLPVTITYFPPRNSRMDWDNISKRAKQGFDAVAEAIGVDDGRWWPVTLQRGAPVKGGSVMIEFRSELAHVPYKGVIE